MFKTLTAIYLNQEHAFINVRFVGRVWKLFAKRVTSTNSHCSKKTCDFRWVDGNKNSPQQFEPFARQRRLESNLNKWQSKIYKIKENVLIRAYLQYTSSYWTHHFLYLRNKSIFPLYTRPCFKTVVVIFFIFLCIYIKSFYLSMYWRNSYCFIPFWGVYHIDRSRNVSGAAAASSTEALRTTRVSNLFPSSHFQLHRSAATFLLSIVSGHK